jgi:oligoendopeptidase F
MPCCAGTSGVGKDRRHLGSANSARSGAPPRAPRPWDRCIARPRSAIRFDDAYRFYWSYIPHFIHTPFYVYANAFGDCRVNSLYAVYEDAQQGFAQRYLAMLRAGGTLRHHELLAPFGLDAADPAFWSKGLGVIRGFIDEIKSACMSS